MYSIQSYECMNKCMHRKSKNVPLARMKLFPMDCMHSACHLTRQCCIVQCIPMHNRQLAVHVTFAQYHSCCIDYECTTFYDIQCIADFVFIAQCLVRLIFLLVHVIHDILNFSRWHFIKQKTGTNCIHDKCFGCAI